MIKKDGCLADISKFFLLILMRGHHRFFFPVSSSFFWTKKLFWICSVLSWDVKLDRRWWFVSTVLAFCLSTELYIWNLCERKGERFQTFSGLSLPRLYLIYILFTFLVPLQMIIPTLVSYVKRTDDTNGLFIVVVVAENPTYIVQTLVAWPSNWFIMPQVCMILVRLGER